MKPSNDSKLQVPLGTFVQGNCSLHILLYMYGFPGPRIFHFNPVLTVPGYNG